VFLLQLSRFRHWLMHGPTDAERARICWPLAGMHWSVSVSYENGKAVGVQWHDCGLIVLHFACCPMSRLPSSCTHDRKITAIRRLQMTDSSAPVVCVPLICGMNCLFYGAIPDTKSPAADTRDSSGKAPHGKDVPISLMAFPRKTGGGCVKRS
jgi:hypothetical protein